MKKILFTASIFLLPFLLTAQNRNADSEAINKVVDAMIASWNNHDYSDMVTYATEDCDWVNVKGMWWKGRKEVMYAHQVYHNTFFKTVSLEKKSADIRFLTSDVALVHLSWHTGAFTTPGGTKVPEGDDLATLVMVKQEGKWLLTATENVNVVEASKKSNPVLKMPE